MSVLFTSDQHWFHQNIVDYCNRPCSKENHNEYLLDIYNSYIKPIDTVYSHGDLFCGKSTYEEKLDILRKLNGNWKFILGNHDQENQLKQLCKDSNNEYLGIYHETRLNNKKFIMMHYPIEIWDEKHYGSIHTFGHLHNNSVTSILNRFNVCFDVEHRPFTLEEILDQSVSINRDH